MRIDLHTHAWHRNIAPRAVGVLEKAFGAHCEGSGVFSDLLREEAALSMDVVCPLCCADSPATVKAVNAFARLLLKSSRRAPGEGLPGSPLVLPFATVHPAMENAEAELDALERDGIGGIKLHPDWQGFSLEDDGLLDPLFEALAGRFLVLIHVGPMRGAVHGARRPSSPAALLRLARRHGNVDIVGAHFGGCRVWDEVTDVFGGLADSFPANLSLDTSSTSAHVPPAKFRELVELFPFERLLFGSDWPIAFPGSELTRLAHPSRLGGARLAELLSHAEPLLRRYYPRHFPQGVA